ncbi:MAG: helix-turn-helix domain-containing protein [Sulfolobales archaeon]
MKLPCEVASQRLLPIIKACIAKELVEKYGLTQVEAAKKLGTTQAAISQYLHHRRGLKNLDEFKRTLSQIQPVISELANELYSGKMNSDKLSSKLCEICMLIRKTTPPYRS